MDGQRDNPGQDVGFPVGGGGARVARVRAALYLRSSKDRADVSIDAQRRELQALAQTRGFEVATEFTDAVESGSTDDRPGFRDLVAALKNPQRGWAALLVYDTSRLARRRYIAQALKHEARKRGVVIHYAKLPQDLDPIAEIILQSVFEAMDEVHSLMSREKGLAGMRENVKQGWRAGGRAPLGYRLEVHPTGAVRDGKPVTKSKLVPGHDARIIGQYLKARAQGQPRTQVLRRIELARAASTMVHVEWNALTYAGHTVWNVHAPEGGHRRRPRAEWTLQRDTHPALITDLEAEALLAQLENSDIGKAVSAGKGAAGRALLGGLLVSPEGQPWRAHGAHYRLWAHGGQPGKLVKAEMVDRAVLDKLRADLGNLKFWQGLLDASKQLQTAGPDIGREVVRLERERERAVRLSVSSPELAGSLLEVAVERGREIDALRREAEARTKEGGLSALIERTTAADLATMALQAPERAVATLVERVVLTPGLDCRIDYRSPGCRSVASPGRPDRSTPAASSIVWLVA